MLQNGYLYPLIFEPGQGWAYGSGMDWASRTVGFRTHPGPPGGGGQFAAFRGQKTRKKWLKLSVVAGRDCCKARP